MAFNDYGIDRIEHDPVNMDLAKEAERRAFFHDSEYLRLLAEKLAYYPHDPATLEKLYDLSLRKAPASHLAFFSYAYYTAARNCCRDRVEFLLQETVRRCPTHPRMQRIAATYFMNLKNRQQALYFIKKAIELDPSSAPELYRMLQQEGSSPETVLAVTPAAPDAQLQLALYFSQQGDSGKQLLAETLQRLGRAKLSADQHLQAATLALSAGLYDIAAREAERAGTDRETKPDALALKAQILWRQGNAAEALRTSDQAEQMFREQGAQDQAVRYAMSIAGLLQSNQQTAEAKGRMLRIVNDYPSYAPAFYQMAQYSRADSAELELFYLKKARDLAPENIEYRKLYAQRLLESNRLSEAEAAYADMLRTGDAQKDGYLGIARCRMASGDLPGAIAILQQAVQRAVTSEEIYSQLGHLYASAGEYEKAALTFLEVSRLNPNSTESINLAADAYLNLGRYPYARDLYQRVLQKEPANRHALDGIASLHALGY